MTKQNSLRTCDIFCRVIDNFGDIGVCWRLARQLANEYPFSVRLWVDKISALRSIVPQCELVDGQVLAGVTVRIWQDQVQTNDSADIVIEAFACHLPDSYIALMKNRTVAPQWLNLEYLSAETWVDEHHQLVSVHPSTGLKKTFFFPGFTDSTGGLLRESDLITRRNHFFSAGLKQAFQSHFLAMKTQQ
jgi:uncharacterized repeat protein (TIGR03837 family)